MKKQHLIKIFPDRFLMNNISDKLVITIILITIIFVFGLIFSIKSPERKVIDSPIIWKDDYTNIVNFRSNKINPTTQIII